MSLVQFTSSLFGLMSQLKLPYVTSLIRSDGTWSFWMNLIMSVPLMCLFLSSWASCPNLVAAEMFHVFCNMGAKGVVGNSGMCWFLYRELVVRV